MVGNQRRAIRRGSVAQDTTPAARRRVDGKGKRKRDKDGQPISDQTASDAPEAAVASGLSSSNEKAKQKKGDKKKQGAKQAQVSKTSAVEAKSQPSVANLEVDGDDEVDNKEFARQLSVLKTGTSLSAPGKTSQQQVKTRKLSKIKGQPSNGRGASTVEGKGMSTNSSTTGADGDDDFSSINSPEVKAVESSIEPSGISDMLEAPTPGPAVLRLVESQQPQRPKQPKQSKVAQEQESKKQRQNKAKTEARKAEREQMEKERRVLLEKQLRTAREAEGRPAKNGVPVAKPPPSIWTKPSNGEANVPPPSAATNGVTRNPAALLDTFDSKTAAPATSSQGQKAANGTAASTMSAWENEQRSEEEQMRLLSQLEGDDSWETVNVKKREKKKASNTDNATAADAKPQLAPKISPDASTKKGKQAAGGNQFSELKSEPLAEVEDGGEVSGHEKVKTDRIKTVKVYNEDWVKREAHVDTGWEVDPLDG